MARKRQKWWAPRTRVHNVSFAMRFCEAVDTPVSLGVYLRLKYGEFNQLAAMSVGSAQYVDPVKYFLDSQALATISKWENLPTTIDRQKAALEKFAEAEKSCSETNARFFDAARRREAETQLSPSAREAFHLMRRKIAAILGPVPSYEELDFRFGPGAALGVRGDTSHYKKIHSVLECSFAMLPVLGDFLAEFPGWVPEGTHHVDVVEGSELTFVRKNAETDRTIGIEPLLNGLYQKGVGSYMRGRLRRWGVNLNDQGVNQLLAGLAHVWGLATVDFKSASDTIAYALVLDQLPIDWVEFLDVARSACYLYDGKWTEFEKFSSMGNAYTFELETLLFFAMAISCCEVAGVSYSVQGDLHVYGDDVIIPREVFDLFSEVSSHCGFEINQSKSFAEGRFFESCGCDYFDGHDVRPFFLKKDVRTLGDLYYVANRTNAAAMALADLPVGQDLGDHSSRVERIRALHAWVVGGIPARHRILVPSGQGDVGLECDFDVARPVRSRSYKRRGWEGYAFRRVRQQPIRVNLLEEEAVNMGYATYGLPVLPGAPAWGAIPWREPDEPLDNGSGYTIRNHTRWVQDKGHIAGQWPSAPVWGEDSLAIVSRIKR